MNNFRRRIGSNISYVFSAQSTSVNIYSNASSIGVNITSTANGTNIGYSVVSYDGMVVTRVTTTATRIYIYYSTNSTYDERNGNVVLKQDDSNKTITINVSQSAKPLTINYGGILLDGTSGSNGSISVSSGEVSFSNVPSWANVTYSSGKINVTALSTNSANTARLDTITVNGGSQSQSLRIIQLPSDYHSRSYVSIGGLNWAIKNVGASSVQDYGNYYMYGKGSRTYNSSDSIYEGKENPLASSADTATQVMGSGWRMPTRAEYDALIGQHYYYDVFYNGVNGYVFYDSRNVLFFPASGEYYYPGGLRDRGRYGYYWSSTPLGNGVSAYILVLQGGDKYTLYSSYTTGAPVRGVLV